MLPEEVGHHLTFLLIMNLYATHSLLDPPIVAVATLDLDFED